MASENAVTGPVARAELGKPGPPISASRYSAIKREMGISGQRYVYVSLIRKFIRKLLAENPNWSELDVYPRRSRPNKRTNLRAANGRKPVKPS